MKRISISWENVVKLIGALVAVAGFFVLVCSAELSDNNKNAQLKDIVTVAMVGLSMMAVGSFIVSLQTYARKVKRYGRFPAIVENVIGSMTYSQDYHSWISVQNYRNDLDWEFVLCSFDGKPKSKPIKSTQNIMNLNWYR